MQKLPKVNLKNSSSRTPSMKNIAFTPYFTYNGFLVYLYIYIYEKWVVDTSVSFLNIVNKINEIYGPFSCQVSKITSRISITFGTENSSLTVLSECETKSSIPQVYCHRTFYISVTGVLKAESHVALIKPASLEHRFP